MVQVEGSIVILFLLFLLVNVDLAATMDSLHIVFHRQVMVNCLMVLFVVRVVVLAMISPHAQMELATALQVTSV